MPPCFHVRRLLRLGLPFVAVVAVAGLAPAPAAAVDRPPNDNLNDATVLRGLPVATQGTTVGARIDETDPAVPCGKTNRTVWYRWRADTAGVAVVKVTVDPKLDAVVAAYRVDRTSLRPVACRTTDSSGLAPLAFRVRRGAAVMIVVGKLTTSRSGRFGMRLLPREPRAVPPGEPLPATGVRATVDAASDLDDAYSMSLVRGTTYRIRMAPVAGRCLALAVYRPGTLSFRRAEPVTTERCGGYLRLTPGPDGGGVYSFVVSTHAGRGGPQAYRLDVAPAKLDDGAPGVPLESGSVVHGSLDGNGLDVLDVYRFDVFSGSEVTLDVRMRKPFDLLVLTSDGKVAAGVHDVSTGRGHVQEQLPVGHYFAAVRAGEGSSGLYRLSLFVRAVTTTSLLVSGSTHADLLPGVPAVLTVTTTAAAPTAPIQVEIDRFDPFDKWQFSTIYTLRAGGGYASMSWMPPYVGEFRIRARLLGTLTSAYSDSDYVYVTVGSRLR